MANRTISENWSPFLWWPSWSPDGRCLTTSCSEHPEIIQLLDMNGGAYRELVGHSEGVNAAPWSSDGKLVASASWDGTVRVWSPEGNCITAVELIRGGSVECVSWSSDNTKLAAVCSDGSAYILSLPSASIVQKWDFPCECFYVAFSPDNRAVAVTKEDGWSFINLDSGQVTDRAYKSAGIELLWRNDAAGILVTADDGTVWYDDGDNSPRLLRSLSHAARGIDRHVSGAIAIGDIGGKLYITADNAVIETEPSHDQKEIVAIRWRPHTEDLFVGTRGYGAWINDFCGLLGNNVSSSSE